MECPVTLQYRMIHYWSVSQCILVWWLLLLPWLDGWVLNCHGWLFIWFLTVTSGSSTGMTSSHIDSNSEMHLAVWMFQIWWSLATKKDIFSMWVIIKHQLWYMRVVVLSHKYNFASFLYIREPNCIKYRVTEYLIPEIDTITQDMTQSYDRNSISSP